ncbi:hypothetical protein [Candidatus Burkholderia verschuerenii]|uniref:hypothetical protein n=1 Tax=Candidatus Burkholderia verschuerenii TaxID=242163 RepID=UPI0018DE4B6E|nr:hypothetical protein [Candidatus Burkholderia verschuerenii]
MKEKNDELINSGLFEDDVVSIGQIRVRNDDGSHCARPHSAHHGSAQSLTLRHVVRMTRREFFCPATPFRGRTLRAAKIRKRFTHHFAALDFVADVDGGVAFLANAPRT